jgi:hypothetical protein
MEGMQMNDTIILDRHKCNAELLTIHADGTITAAEHLKPTETAAKVLQIMRETWMDDAQATKIREQEERIKRLEEFARTIENDFDHDEDAHRYGTTCRVCDAEDLLKETKAKEAKL